MQYIANSCSNNDDEEENQSKWFLTGAYMYGNTDRICDIVTSNNNTANGYAFDDDDKEAGVRGATYLLICACPTWIGHILTCIRQLY